jgi:hypothetical protein
MNRKIFVNLAVADLKKSMEFFRRLGFDFNEQFSDDTAACMIIGDDSYAMLLTRDKFKTFTPRTVADPRRSTEVLTSLSCDSRAAVDDLVAKAKAAGGDEVNDVDDRGFMYMRSITDLDGHIWELVWMDQAHIERSAA